MKKYLFKFKWLFILTITLKSLNALMQIYVAILIQKIINITEAKNINNLLNILIFSAIYFFIFAIINFLSKKIQYLYVKKTIVNIKNIIIKGILNKSMRLFYKKDTAEYVSNLTNDIGLFESNYIIPILELFSDLLLFTGTIIVLLKINVIITLCMIVASIFLLLIPIFFTKSLKNSQELLSKSLSNFTNCLKDFFSGFNVIKNFSVEKFAESNIDKCSETVEYYKYRSNSINAMAASLSLLLIISLQVFTISLGGYFYIIGSISIGSIFAIIQLSTSLYTPLMQIVNRFTIIKGCEKINDKLNELLINKPNINVNQIKDFKSFELKKIFFSYDNTKKYFLNRIDLKFERGKKYLIVGHSGSGKSTLLNIITGNYSDYIGDILINDIVIDKKVFNSKILFNYVDQNEHIFNMTIKENILLGREYNENNLKKSLNISRCEDIIENFNSCFQSIENGYNLSGGEKQKISIARALLELKEIIILDEAMSGIDQVTAIEIEKDLLKINKTVIVVSHRLNKEILDLYDEIIVLENGSIVEKGNFRSLMKIDSLLKKMITI